MNEEFTEDHKKYLKKVKEIGELIKGYKKPIIFYDDDPDGLSSFMLMRKFVDDCTHFPVKASPILKETFLDKVKEIEPDVIIVLDKPLISEEFIDGTKLKIIWIDHHKKEKIKRSNLTELNSRDFNLKEYCTTHIMYDMLNNVESMEDYEKHNKTDWIAMTGCVGDWTLPLFFEQFKNNDKDLIPQEIDKPEEALFRTKMGDFIKIISFVLKLDYSKYKRCLKHLFRVNDPFEVLNRSTESGEYIAKSVSELEKEYNELLERAKNTEETDGMKIFSYQAAKYSFTKEISNEMLYLFPDKAIIIGREKDGEVKISLRSKEFLLQPVLEKALEGIDGYGGGHEYACGANVKSEQFERFTQQFKEALKNR